MEPGHEDREYTLVPIFQGAWDGMPQWSPVMKTGNTAECHKMELS